MVIMATAGCFSFSFNATTNSTRCTHMTQQLWTAVDTYINDLFNPQDEILEKALRASMREGKSLHCISPNQGKLLHMLALLCRAKTILEIGTLAGYSSMWLARALPEDGRLITLEYHQHHATLARQHLAQSGLSSKVEVREGDAFITLSQLEDEGVGPFDMVFLDVDDKRAYLPLLEKILRLTRPGTLIAADNAVRSGRVANSDETDGGIIGVQQFNSALARHPAITATIIQMVGMKGWDGIALAIVTE
jgi:caffeoyl-CoA O-methyltransferase